MKRESAIVGKTGARVRAARWGGSIGRRLGVDAASKLAAETIGRALQFLLFYLAQRSLGPTGYGEFAFALASGFVLATLTDAGLHLTLTREMARSASSPAAAGIASVAVSAKLALMLLATALLAAFSLTRSGPAQLPTFVVGVALICVSLVETLGHVFRGLQRTRDEAGLVLVQRLITFALGTVAIVRGYGVLGLGTAYLAGGSLTVVLGLLWLRRRFFTLRLVVAPRAWWDLLRPALPLGGAIVLSVLYTRTAVLLLDALQGAEAVGLFGVAQKLTEPMAMVPAAVMAAVFPAYSQALVRNGEQSGWLSRWSVGLLALAGTGLASVGVLAGPRLIEQLYGEPYRGSSLPLQVLSLALVLTFVNYALTHFLIAAGRQVLNLLFSAVLLCANAVLCVVLIPRHGPAGAAAAVVVCELLLLILCCSALYARERTS